MKNKKFWIFMAFLVFAVIFRGCNFVKEGDHGVALKNFKVVMDYDDPRIPTCPIGQGEEVAVGTSSRLKMGGGGDPEPIVWLSSNKCSGWAFIAGLREKIRKIR